jgi:hypothetical protein
MASHLNSKRFLWAIFMGPSLAGRETCFKRSGGLYFLISLVLSCLLVLVASIPSFHSGIEEKIYITSTYES